MALRRVSLRNFVLVSELELDLRDGFTALTGETGAGKSILVDALQLALGERADAGVVRSGCPRAEIAAEIDPPAGACAWLEAAGFEHEGLLVRRVIESSGKSRAWINGSPATSTQLRALAELLVDIHGQHAWQSLTKPAAIRALLDGYGSSPVDALTTAWSAWQAAQQRLRAATEQAEARRDGIERLQWQVQEVDKLGPQADEWDSLNARHHKLAHHQELLQAATTAQEQLQGDGAAIDLLNQAHQEIQRKATIDPSLSEIAEALAGALAQATDAAHSLAHYARGDEVDASELAALDERLSHWVSLSRKYRQPPSDLHSALQTWKQTLAGMEHEADLQALAEDERRARWAYDQAAQQVTAARQRSAPKLARAITQAMQQLGMAGGRFDVRLSPLTEPAAYGAELVEFWVAGHAGQTPGAIQKVASGGELSRIALAIAVTTSRMGEVPTLIFDEVDVGIGGAVAQTVGRLLRQLGAERQVLAVTHLPQVAACAHHHLLVSKAVHNGVAQSQVEVVTGPEREHEVARMLGGEVLTPTSLAHARELLHIDP